MASASTELEPLLRFDEPSGASARTKRHALYLVFTIIVSVIVIFAVVEAVVGIPGYGVDSTVSRASAGGTTLSVRHADVTRGQLAAPFEITVQRDGGFDGPLILAVSSSYLDLFITNDLSPAPKAGTSTEDDLIMTFDTPSEGDVMTVQWDVVTKPSSFFTTGHGTVSVLGSDGKPEVSVSFDTEVRV